MDFKNVSFSKFFKKRKNCFLGVDVGSSSIKIVQLEKKGEKIFLSNYAIISSKEENFVQVGNYNVITKISEQALLNVFEKAGINNKEVNVAVPGFASLIATIEIPQSSDKDAEKVVRNEISKYIPLPLEEIVYGWTLIKNIPDKEGNNFGPIRAIVVAVMKQVSKGYQLVFNKANLKIENLEVSSFSLVRALNEGKEDCAVILDIGASNTNLIINWEENVLFEKTIDVAGKKITEVIANVLGVDEQRAEQFKIKEGLETNQSNLREVIENILLMIIKEVKEVLGNFQKSYPTIYPRRIVLTGGTSNLKGIENFFVQNFQQEIVIGNPFRKILFPSELKDAIMELKGQLAVAIGLALLGFKVKF